MSLVSLTLLYASEFYWPSHFDMSQLKSTNKGVTYWILPVENYKERLLQLEVLPASFIEN